MTEVAAKPNLLFLAQVLPYPPDGGVKIRTYHILRLLTRRFKVTAICFYRQKDGMLRTRPDESTAALRNFCDVRAFPIPQDESKLRFAWDHVRSCALRRVYTYFVYQSGAFARALSHVRERNDFAVVHVDSLDLSHYLPLVDALPTICTHHDVESDLLRRRAELEGFVSRSYLFFQAGLMEKEERAWCPRVTFNVTVSERDRDLLRRLAPGASFEVVPNGVDTDYFRATSGSDTGLVFVGGTTWFPNADALKYFTSSLLPRLKEATPEPVDVTWVGRASAHEVIDYNKKGVNMTGYVEDIRPYVERAACYIVPLRVGGGTRIKILDAWAMGKAVVSTSIGCAGLDARDGENILIRDGEAEFVQGVVSVLQNEHLRRRLGTGGRKTVEEKYSWNVIGDRMNEMYLKVAGKG